MDVANSSFPAKPAFFAYIPFLWRCVLFPGTVCRQKTSAIAGWLVAVVLPALLLYPCLSFHLFEPDEGRYAEIPREMLARGDWLVPHLAGQPYLEKPPLMYWLVMVSYRLFGVYDWSARLVPALAVQATIVLTYLFGRQILGGRAAFWGTLTLVLAPAFLGMGRLLLLDGVLTFFVWLSVYSAWQAIQSRTIRSGWWLGCAVASGLATLTKGPVALVLLLPPVWLFSRWTEGVARPGLRDGLLFAGVYLLVAAPWYLAILVRMPAFAIDFFWTHNVMRFVDPFDHERPVWFYLPIVVAGLLPASLWGMGFARFLFTGEEWAVQRRCPELGFLLLVSGWCIFFFSLSGCKLPTYVLPAFPPLALALGYYLSLLSSARLHWLKVSFALSAVVLFLAHYVVIPEYARFRSPMNRAEQVAAYCAGKPVICYPRPCDSVAFYLGRDDFRSYRSKYTPQLIERLQKQPESRTAILFTHRHSLEGLRRVLPPGLHLTSATPLSYSWKRFFEPEACYMAIIERRP
ncbi:MAG: hypothetical protein KatS3mg105_2196 [Gemmatales bacterium]|nr:MAG: hypothetical protein KatS3mg105_2196 [Gemmatales bacterium]